MDCEIGVSQRRRPQDPGPEVDSPTEGRKRRCWLQRRLVTNYSLTGVSMKILTAAILTGLTMVGGCAWPSFGLMSEPPTSPEPAPQAKPAAAKPLPLTPSERRRQISATGYAVISIQPHSHPAQQRLLAIRASKLEAYRGLTEQVYGQYLDSSTTIADATIRSDRVRARVEGLIHGAEVVSITPVGNDTYETTLAIERDTMLELRAMYLEEMARYGR